MSPYESPISNISRKRIKNVNNAKDTPKLIDSNKNSKNSTTQNLIIPKIAQRFTNKSSFSQRNAYKF
jgi:hypothetical protein